MNLSGIKTFLRYYNCVNKAKLMEMMEYRVDLIMITLSAYGYNIAALLFLEVIFINIDSLAGWAKHEVLFFYGTSELIWYIYWTFFSYTDDRFIGLIQKGDLDIFLLKPVNALASIVTRSFALFEEIPPILLALGIIVYSGVKLGVVLDYRILIYAFLVICSVMIGLAVRATISILSFWFTDTDEIRRFYVNVNDSITYAPLDVFPKALQSLFRTIIPMGLLSYVPTTFLIKGVSTSMLINFFLVLAVSSFLMLYLWKRGLKIYSSASS